MIGLATKHKVPSPYAAYGSACKVTYYLKHKWWCIFKSLTPHVSITAFRETKSKVMRGISFICDNCGAHLFDETYKKWSLDK